MTLNELIENCPRHIGSGLWDCTDIKFIQLKSSDEPCTTEEELQKHIDERVEKWIRYHANETNEASYRKKLETWAPDILNRGKLIQAFLVEYKDTYCIAQAYDVYPVFLLSDTPKAEINYEGYGFEGHGTSAMIANCPKTLLILGQND